MRVGHWSGLHEHPRGLVILFLTETWERFSFYGMRALLVLYMTEQLLLPDNAVRVLGHGPLKAALESVFGPLSVQALASQTYGLYSSLLFFTPFFGGLLADRVLGTFKTVVLGAVLMAAGHFLMASDEFFLVALLCIVLGNGCFKPNISTQVGRLYPRTDGRRDRAFSIFYVGINLGATIAPLICGTLGEVYGWHWGFLAAGVGMIAGLVIFVAGRRYLPPEVATAASSVATGSVRRALRPAELRAIAALCLIAFVITFFWAGYEQQGNAVVLWIRDYTDRSVFGLFDIPITWFQSFNPALIFLLTPGLVAYWARVERDRRGRGPIAKLATGCFVLSAAYAIMTVAALFGGPDDRVSWLWSFAYFVLLTLAELHVSPVALSLFSSAAPASAASMMMGVWFMSGVLGNYLSGVMGSFWEKLPKPMFWGVLGVVPLLAGFAVLSLAGLLNGVMREQAALDQESAA